MSPSLPRPRGPSSQTFLPWAMLHSLHCLGGPWLDSLDSLLYGEAHKWAQQSRCASSAEERGRITECQSSHSKITARCAIGCGSSVARPWRRLTYMNFLILPYTVSAEWFAIWPWVISSEWQSNPIKSSPTAESVMKWFVVLAWFLGNFFVLIFHLGFVRPT